LQKSSRNSTKIKHVKIILKRLKSSNNRSQARKQRDPINRAKHKHRHTSLSKRWKKWHHHLPLHQKNRKKLLQGFEFSLQERSSERASKMKLGCNFSRSFFVQMLLLVVVVVLLLLLPPDLCKASERASDGAAEKQQNRSSSGLEDGPRPAPSLPPSLTPL
jgi:hypothetical protein